MFISPAYAQVSGAGGAGGLEAMLPLVLIFVVFYFLLIRPQQKKMKDHRAMLGDVRRGDKIVTGGGIMGTITKVDDDSQITVEIAKDVKVKVRRELISAVLNKTEPFAANDSNNKPSGGFLSSLFGGGAKQVATTSLVKEPIPEKKEHYMKSKPVKSKPVKSKPVKSKPVKSRPVKSKPANDENSK
jgi:preprotein translocase subunit YajC